MSLNEYFEGVFCVNLDEATDRWNFCVDHFNKQNIQIERFSAIKPESDEKVENLMSGEIGCLLSHLEIIKISKERGYKRVLILEDDVEFVENVNEVFSEYVKEVPEDFSFLYFGGNHIGGWTQVSPHLAKIRKTYTTNAYAISESMYDILIPTLTECKKQVDVYYSDWHSRTNSFVFRPHLAWQRSGYSYIQKGYQNYDFLKN